LRSARMKIALISTYELGRQPFGLASPTAWLRARGHDVACLDLSRELLDEESVCSADLIAFYLPMHTATRLAAQLVPAIRALNAHAHLCFYGLYAPVNESYLRELGAGTILGGEFEEGLVRLAERLQSCANGGHNGGSQPEPVISLARQQFVVPDRAGLPPLAHYAHVVMPSAGHRVVGYTEASRGCKHLCRHCPIVPVYNGAFRIVAREIVLEDIRRQVAAGAAHITFGDPDFFNGPAHALSIVKALHEEFPALSYDVTIKIEHLRKHDADLAALRDTGCLFVTSAVESVDDAELARLDKGHTRADFLRIAARFRELGMTLAPAFVPFTPWTTLAGFRDLLRVIAENDLVENVAPIQLGIRLLIPAGSRLLELAEARAIAGPFDRQSLVHPWKHSDPRVDALCARVLEIVQRGEKFKRRRAEIFEKIWRAAAEAGADDGAAEPLLWQPPVLLSRAAVPFLNEPWYC